MLTATAPANETLLPPPVCASLPESCFFDSWLLSPSVEPLVVDFATAVASFRRSAVMETPLASVICA